MKQDHNELWQQCLAIFRDNLGDGQSYQTWFKPIIPLKLVNNTLIIQVPSQFYYEWLEEHYIDLIRKTIRKIIGGDARLEYSILMDPEDKYSITGESTHKKETQNKPTSLSLPDSRSLPNPFVIPGMQKIKIESQLNENYSFDNYIEGDCNRLARAAGYAIAENPGKTAFNPLFLHSDVGLGKTHLMHAIGIQTKANYPELTVLYVSAEYFTQQFVDSTRFNTYNDFAHFYQLIDVLLIDDIHKLSNKTATQNAFFNIFNHLQQSGKQIVLSSDKAPVELTGIEPRLLSRFKWGLATDLQVPDVETRIAILQQKIHANGVEMPSEVIEYIAYSINTNVRELEGVLNSLLAQSILANKTITLELAKQMIDKIVDNSSKEISIEFIKKIICDHFGMSMEEIDSKSRKRDVVQTRQLAMYFSKLNTKSSLATIGLQCGNKDHATVLHACKTVSNLMETDKSFKSKVEDLSKKIRS